MSHRDSEQKKSSRQITYRVGWKKGNIQLDSQTGTRLIQDRIWRRFPFIPYAALGWCIWLLPAISLALTILMINALLIHNSP